jgi:antitoxin component YwqK of YwqJK toxin-antitoxin module
MDETPYTEGKENGVERSYYSNGKLEEEIHWTYGNAGVKINYDENGDISKP